MSEDQDAMPEDQDKKHEIISREVTEVRSYSGPIPSAEEFARYEEVLPGSADRLISMAEREQTAIVSFRSKALVAATLVAIGTIAAITVILTLGEPEHVFMVAALALAQVLPPVTNLLKGISDNRMAMKKQELDLQIKKDHHELDMKAERQRLSLPPGSDVDSSRTSPRLVSENEQSDDKEGSSKD